jgi:hypothetical protein
MRHAGEAFERGAVLDVSTTIALLCEGFVNARQGLDFAPATPG